MGNNNVVCLQKFGFTESYCDKHMPVKCKVCGLEYGEHECRTLSCPEGAKLIKKKPIKKVRVIL